MNLPNPAYEVPAEDARIWRYLDLAKFLRLLQSGSLFFCAAKQLSDNYEGCLTRPSLSEWIKRLKSERDCSEEGAYEISEFMKHMVGVSCWHLSDRESPAMWKLYSQDQAGIAVQSTFGRLAASFANLLEPVSIGKVRYIDYAIDHVGNVDDAKAWFLCKRKEFAHEQELRAMMVLAPDVRALGKEVSCDLTVLIESIRISPTAPPYMLEVVREICQRFKMQIEVKPSSLQEPPPRPAAATAAG